MYAQFFVLFAIMLTGYIFRKKGVIDGGMDTSLNRFIVYFAYPCMIVINIGTLEMSHQLMIHFFIVLTVYVAIFFVFALFARLYTKARKYPDSYSNVAEFAMVSPNNGFMGFPVAQIFFGSEGLFLMLACNAAMNIFFFTYGIALMQRNKEKEPFRIKKILDVFVKLIINPNILALIIGLLLCLSKTEIPLPVYQYLSFLGNVSTPMALIYIGSSLATSSFFDIIKNKHIIECTVNKLLVMPLLSYAILIFTPLDPLLIAMMVLSSCFPTAATVSMLAQQEGQDTVMASQILFLNTLFSAASIPFIIYLINTLIL